VIVGAEWVLPGDSRGVQDRRGYLRARDTHRRREAARRLMAAAFRLGRSDPSRWLIRSAVDLARWLMARPLCLLLAWQRQSREVAARLVAVAPAPVPASVPAARWSRLWVLSTPPNGPNVAVFGTRRLGT
jgi:hypothetical protein